MTFHLILWLFSLALVNGLNSQLRTYNIDPKFSRWNKAGIAFYIDPYYTTSEASLIREAIQQLSNNMQQCLRFLEVSLSDPRFKIHISPHNEYGVLQTFCYSYPGVHTTLVNFRQTKQLLVITRGPNGCLNGSLRAIMKIIVIALGRRNEHQRGDRDNYLQVNLANVAVANSYRLFNKSETYWNLFPYDYCSITHNQPEDYAIPGTTVFTPKSNPPVIPNLDRISNIDCQLISLIYQCPRAKCTAFNCTAAQIAAAVSASTTLAMATATTAISSFTSTFTDSSKTVNSTATIPSTTMSTQCPLSRFCEISPDESTYLNGPWLLSQRLLMFSGPCVMEYNYNWTTKQIVPQSDPQLIRDYFPAPGGPSTQQPYSLAYQTLNQNTGNSYYLTIVNPFAGTANSLTCSMDPSLTTHAATCPSPTTNTDPTALAASPTVSSASSQLNLMDNKIYHYVVLRPARAEIGLMNNDFSIMYNETVGFLTTQSKIAQITAIQILNDPTMTFSPPLMAVFGYGGGPDNSSAYVGFTVMPLGADSTAALTPFTWQGQPQLLHNIIVGC